MTRLTVPVEPKSAEDRWAIYMGGIVPQLRQMEMEGRIPPGTAEAVYADTAEMAQAGHSKALLSQLHPDTVAWVRAADHEYEEGRGINDPAYGRDIIAHRPGDW